MRKWTAVAIFGALLFGGGTLAAGQRAATDTTYYACVSTAGVVRAGSIHLGVAPTRCPNGNDRVEQWAMTGPQGPAGPVRARVARGGGAMLPPFGGWIPVASFTPDAGTGHVLVATIQTVTQADGTMACTLRSQIAGSQIIQQAVAGNGHAEALTVQMTIGANSGSGTVTVVCANGTTSYAQVTEYTVVDTEVSSVEPLT